MRLRCEYDMIQKTNKQVKWSSDPILCVSVVLVPYLSYFETFFLFLYKQMTAESENKPEAGYQKKYDLVEKWINTASLSFMLLLRFILFPSGNNIENRWTNN